MALKLYNSLTRTIEPFQPRIPGKVGMYMCGPTVYNYAHIGNFRSFVLADLLRRYFAFSGLAVKHVMNLTDIDDKTIKGSQAQGKTLKEFTEYYADEFFKDFHALGCQDPTVVTKATEYIEKMINLVQRLLDKGLAYEKNGSVYFSIAKDEHYGELACIDAEALLKNADGRLNDADEYDKENARDFALWKAWSAEDGDVFWESPWGRGRPGWHLECSVMSMDQLGETFDIHAGGVDLRFPHHTNEIAQSEGATGKKYVNHWAHFEFLIVEGEKMSKSLGNFYTLRDLAEKGWTGREVRYVLLSTQYRQKLNFTFAGLEGARKTLARIDDFLLRMQESDGSEDATAEINVAKEKFSSSMDDDLNISGAFAAIHECMRDVNKKQLSKEAAQDVLALFYSFDEVLGLGFKDIKAGNIDAAIEAKIKERDEARKHKDWATSDKIRDELLAQGIELLDTPDGTKWRKK